MLPKFPLAVQWRKQKSKLTNRVVDFGWIRRYIRWIHPITPKTQFTTNIKNYYDLYIMTDDVTLLIPILPHIRYPMKWVCCKYYSCFIRLQSVLFRRNVRYQSKSGFWKSSIKLYSNDGATLWSFWPSLSE